MAGRQISSSAFASTSSLSSTPSPSTTLHSEVQSPSRGTRLYASSAKKILDHLTPLLAPHGCTLGEQEAVTACTAKGGLTEGGEGHNARMSFLGKSSPVPLTLLYWHTDCSVIVQDAEFSDYISPFSSPTLSPIHHSSSLLNSPKLPSTDSSIRKNSALDLVELGDWNR